MTPRSSHRSRWLAAAGAVGVLLASQPAVADTRRGVEEIAGTTVFYKVVVPKDYDPAKEYPAVLAFPRQDETMPLADEMIARNLGAQAERRGYIVVVAAAPETGLFHQGGERVFPELLDKLLAEYKVRGRKFHIAGISNGGLSAFHIAASYPRYFWSVTGFPGYLPDATAERTGALKGMCLNMHAGELDPGWLKPMQQQAARFSASGIQVRFTIEKGQHHVMTTLEGAGAARLFDQFDEAKGGCAK
jgi:predicted esterase